MNEKDRNTLLGYVATDQKFRSQLLKDPRNAAAKLKIKLTASEAAKISQRGTEIATNCARLDERRDVEPCFIPIIKVI